MTDRLNSDALDFIRETRSAHDPDAADKARVERSLAVALGAASLASATTHGAVLSTLKGTGASLSLLGMAKVAAVVASVVAIGAVTLNHRPRANHEVSTQTAAPLVRHALPAKAPKTTEVANVQTPVSQPETAPISPVSAPALVSRRPRATTGAEPATTVALTPSIAQETQLMRDAMLALREDHAAEALNLVDRHAREFPSSTISLERSMLRVDALCALGRTEEARSQATALLSSNPSALVQRRIENSCAAQ